MFKTVTLAILAACLASCAMAAVPADRVKTLPGLFGDPTSPQYSGYLSVGNGKHLHYWLVESESNTASTDPLVIWFNGGPGCSSLDGYFYEHGPYHIVEPIEDPNNPELYLNDNRWNKKANMLYLEAPAGVGYSYADTKAGLNTNDTQTAEDNLAAVVAFFQAYPEYVSNEMFIAGESYAGAYVPMLALQVVGYNKQASTKINLKGILVGNGVIGEGALSDAVSLKVYTNFYRGHGLASEMAYYRVQTACDNFNNVSSNACQTARKELEASIGNVNIYDIYEPCVNSGFPPSARKGKWSRRPTESFESESLEGPVECINAGAATQYLNLADVRQAIHVKSEAAIGKWEICSSKLNYSVTQGSLIPSYKNTIIPNMRVLIFNGDVDACVPFTHNEWWTSSVNMTVTKPWHAWSVDKQVAGYAVEYGPNFTFCTVKGSGHMVPQYRPVQAEVMFTNFINNIPL
eukprot:m.354340 g.354340  ORF g.354340 m.354340 type:complete len:461 (+) comp16985_c0_seq1:211-1593(+)